MVMNVMSFFSILHMRKMTVLLLLSITFAQV